MLTCRIAVLALSLAAVAMRAQQPTQSAPITAQFNRNVIFLDAAHGGSDTGAHLANQLNEKDVTLAFTLKLRDALTSRGFTVLLSRQNDDTNSPSMDDRAGAANHARPVACILIHATGVGNGVQLYVSSLTPPETEPKSLAWSSAQASWVPQSVRLANELGTALARSHTHTLIHRADPKPLSSLTCPAVALELAPLKNNDGAPAPVSDNGYQQRVIGSLASALTFWKGHADPYIAPGTAPAVTTPSAAPQPSTPPASPKSHPATPANSQSVEPAGTVVFPAKPKLRPIAMEAKR